MYEQENQRKEEHLAVVAGTDPHSADVGLVEHQQEQAGLKIEHGQSGQSGPGAGLKIEHGQSGQNGPGDNRHLQELPSSGGGGGGRDADCSTCKRNFWTSVLNAVIKISTIVLAAFGIQSFGDPPSPPSGG